MFIDDQPLSTEALPILPSKARYLVTTDWYPNYKSPSEMLVGLMEDYVAAVDWHVLLLGCYPSTFDFDSFRV